MAMRRPAQSVMLSQPSMPSIEYLFTRARFASKGGKEGFQILQVAPCNRAGVLIVVVNGSDTTASLFAQRKYSIRNSSSSR